mmetsp:Transcript_60688/g.113404  ORF Transcript_60688/g.113404 Transcript_60688/m.113404 type:complete len:453 (+) Transcript_60688:45-1403(+)
MWGFAVAHPPAFSTRTTATSIAAHKTPDNQSGRPFRWHLSLPIAALARASQKWRAGRDHPVSSHPTLLKATSSQETESSDVPGEVVEEEEGPDEFFKQTFPQPEELEKWVDGKKYILVKYTKQPVWVPEEDVGVYRFSLRGYESRDPDGKWVAHAQMPDDTSHLSDAQRERLILELRGQVNFNLSDGTDEDGFRPLPKVPPLEKWPFYRTDISEHVDRPKELGEYQELDLTEDLPRAFFLASRWKAANEARRHLGYGVNTTLSDVANMNGTVLGFKAMVEQFKRTSKFRRRKDSDPIPSDAERLDKLKVTALLGTKKGSAMSLWCYNNQNQKLLVDLCLGDDCMDQGLYAEEVLLKRLMSIGSDLGATTMWCRSRRTESGKVFLPPPMRSLGFTAVPIEEQEQEEWETLNVTKTKTETSEAVPGLNLWITTRNLEPYLEAANTWCEEMVPLT